MNQGIFESCYHDELISYTRALLRKISKNTNIPFEQLVQIYCHITNNNNKNENVCLEYIELNGIKYYKNIKTNELHSYENPDIIVARLNEYNDIEAIS